MPRHRLDISARRFGRLEALHETGKTSGGKTLWQCVCDCGKLHKVAVNVLTSGRAKSCGCLLKETASKTGRATWKLNHRHVRTTLRSTTTDVKTMIGDDAWASCTFAGCGKPARTRFGLLCDTHYRRKHRSGSSELIGRTSVVLALESSIIDRAGRIVPSRVTAATRVLTFKGVTLGLSDWARAAGLPKSALQWRLRKGWSLERAVTEPLAAKGPLSGRTRVEDPLSTYKPQS